MDGPEGRETLVFTLIERDTQHAAAEDELLPMDAKLPCLEPSIQAFARPLGGPFRVRTKFERPCCGACKMDGSIHPSIHPSWMSTEMGSTGAVRAWLSVESRAHVVVTKQVPRLASDKLGSLYFGREPDAGGLTFCASFSCTAAAARQARPQSPWFLISNQNQIKPDQIKLYPVSSLPNIC